ncbi:D-alanyl-D-alanine carboxypeptidase family protein [Clostridium hydrogeniformans]|uniref:D-alanyl-D-alanine carboxypeptidase family protein n=1 Tax=Clostridium hydrogeniformans TaxID=349933 RepID=UPI00048954D5|nr:D-alanyl-D-alanine carboxypeptidase family protein [Clostridium hydrogeniformans]
MKKFIYIFMSLCLFINIFSIPTRAVEKNNKLNVNAKCAIAIDSKTRRVLYEKNSDKIVPMASTTKIITALVAIKYGNLEDKFIISSNAASIRGSKVGYKKNDEISLKELIVGLMFKSGNDAAIAIAEGISGSIEEFCKLMNEYALEIGLMDSNFESPHGLDSGRHYSTSYDLAIATAKAKENDFFNEMVGKKAYTSRDNNFTRDYSNINKILWQIKGANGVKTGYTGGAGKCLVTSVNNGHNDVIMVVLDCPGRWTETEKIFNYVKENYYYENIKDLNSMDEESDMSIFNEDIYVPIKNGSKGIFKLDKNNNIVNDNKVLGDIKVFEDEVLIYKHIIYK